MKHQQQEKSGHPSRVSTRSSEPAVSVLNGNAAVFQLQRALGNQGVLGFLRSVALQAKLTISRPDDIYEQEADRVADEVMRMPSSAIQTKPG